MDAQRGGKVMPTRNKEVVILKEFNCPYCNAYETVERTAAEEQEYSYPDGEELWILHVSYKCNMFVLSE